MSETPKCPYCGDRMKIRVSLTTPDWGLLSAQYKCMTCESTSPRIEFSGGTSNDEIIERLQAVSSRRVEPKNRVLTLEELRKFDKGEDFVFVWFEYKERMGRYFSLLQVYLLHADDIYVDLVRPDVSICEHFRGDKYGEEWRCWLRKPTAEEMEGTPWNGGAEE